MPDAPPLPPAPPRPPPPPRRAPPPKPTLPAPPLPAPRLAAERARPTPMASMTAGQKQTLTVRALDLLNEQIEARIVHYKGELATSPELDAITAQVVAQLQAVQAEAKARRSERPPPAHCEEEQIRTFQSLLRRVFGPQSQYASRILKPTGRRIAKLFFESELHEKTKADKEKVIHHAEQGVYYVLSRYKHRLRAELEGFAYVNEEIREASAELLAKVERDLQVGFLSRRSPELNRVMTTYAGVLSDFANQHLPTSSPRMAAAALVTAKTARQTNSVPYKILTEHFPAFRAAWEPLFVAEMVSFCGDELLARLTREEENVREETVKFFTDPHVFSETCVVMCQELYDFLCLEGFLDLPVDWRVSAGAEA